MTKTVIDVSALARLKAIIGGDLSDLAELVADFIDNVPGQVAEMRTAEAAGDQARLRIAAHSCKSNARDLGATVLGELCAALELQSKTGALDDPSAQIDAIEKEAGSAITALNDLDLGDV